MLKEILDHDDILVHILTFSTSNDLLNVGVTCSRLSHLIFNVNDEEVGNQCSFIWKELFMNDVVRHECVVVDTTSSNNNNSSGSSSSDSSTGRHHHESGGGVLDWKTKYRDVKTLQFDVENGSDALKNPEEIAFTNRNHTIEKFHYNSGNYWETVRATKALRAPGVYSWKFKLDKFSLCNGNSYCLIVGVESDKYPWKEQGKVTSIIGNFNESEGFGIILGNSQYNYRQKTVAFTESDVTFAQGDEIGVVFEMRRGEDEQGLTSENKITFYKNDKRINVGNVSGPHGDLFYPAVSLIGQIAVSVYYWAPPTHTHMNNPLNDDN